MTDGEFIGERFMRMKYEALVAALKYHGWYCRLTRPADAE